MEISERDLEDFIGGKIIVEDFGFKPKIEKGKIISAFLDRGVVSLVYEVNEKVKNISESPKEKSLGLLLESYTYALCPGDTVISFTSTFVESKTITLFSPKEKFQLVEA
jgi:hypothetical protein